MKIDWDRRDRGQRDADPLAEAEAQAARADIDEFAGERPNSEPEDRAMEAVREAGGGEAEGFELADEQLIDNAEHGGRLRDPATDAFPVEQEPDPAIHGEADGQQLDPDGRRAG
jgi:hypothetical protein